MKLCVAFLLCVLVVVEGRFLKFLKKREYNQQNLLNTNLRCHGEDNGCCTVDNPCGLGDGDCDHDGHCAGDLVCGPGDNSCKGKFGDPGDDCCMPKIYEYPEAQCLQNKWVYGDGEGGSDTWIGAFSTQVQCINACIARRKSDKSINGCTYRRKSYDDDNYCYVEHQMNSVDEESAHKFMTCYLPRIDTSGYRCQGAYDNCCTKEQPCLIGDGDCDRDNQCAGNLVCGSSNCAWGTDTDCCMERHAGDEEEEKEILRLENESRIKDEKNEPEEDKSGPPTAKDGPSTAKDVQQVAEPGPSTAKDVQQVAEEFKADAAEKEELIYI